MIPHLQAQKVKVVTTTAQGMGRACGGFLDDVVQARVSHTGQPPLDGVADVCRAGGHIHMPGGPVQLIVVLNAGIAMSLIALSRVRNAKPDCR